MKSNQTTARLNANINVQLHKTLKVNAASEGTTIGRLIEQWVSKLEVSKPHASGNKTCRLLIEKKQPTVAA